MSILASVFLGLTGLLHVYIFFMESVAWRRPRVWKTFGLASQADADTTAPLAYNQGFYNLFLAIGALLGLVLRYTPATEAGFALSAFVLSSVLLAAIVLLSTGRDRLRSAAVQGTPALLGLVFLLLSL